MMIHANQPEVTNKDDEETTEIALQLSGISLKRKTKPKLDDIINIIPMDYSNKNETIVPISTIQSKSNIKIDAKINKSKNSLVAISGNRAEDLFCESNDIQHYIGSQYFNKKIVKCKKITGNKKSDILITFDDDSQATIQVKNGNGGGRGWSFDRRSVNDLPTTNHSIKELTQIVCLKQDGERKETVNDTEMIKRLLLGDDERTKPEYFIHTNVKNGKIESLSVCTVALFIEKILEEVYEKCNSKKTCVHLSPLIYLQRKGGGKADHSPNDIQAKLRSMPDCMTHINLY